MPKSFEGVSRWNSASPTSWWTLLLLLLLVPWQGVTCFPLSPPTTTTVRRRTTTTTTTRPPWLLFLSSSSVSLLSAEDAFDLERFQRRRQQALQARQQQRIPPHPSLEPLEVIHSVLIQLRSVPEYYCCLEEDDHDDEDDDRRRPHPGVQILWETSTDAWRQTMTTMVMGGNHHHHHHHHHHPSTNNKNNHTTTTTTTLEDDPTRIVSALGRFLARPNQQYAILLGLENQEYHVDFPTDVIEWSDDEAWLECRLRDSQTDDLLVVLGWTLNRNNSQQQQQQQHQASWYIHSFDWQDFRNPYRPGIGREEWERICG
jgi:hypothetical protein